MAPRSLLEELLCPRPWKQVAAPEQPEASAWEMSPSGKARCASLWELTGTARSVLWVSRGPQGLCGSSRRQTVLQLTESSSVDVGIRKLLGGTSGSQGAPCGSTTQEP